MYLSAFVCLFFAACWGSESKAGSILRRTLRELGKWADATLSLQLPLLHRCLRLALAGQNRELNHSLSIQARFVHSAWNLWISQAAEFERSFSFFASAPADCHLSDVMMLLLWALRKPLHSSIWLGPSSTENTFHRPVNRHMWTK